MTLVTVAVNQDDAERLILLTQTGLPYLALLGPSAQIKPDDHQRLSVRTGRSKDNRDDYPLPAGRWARRTDLDHRRGRAPRR